jgi:hypothetical protein
MKIAYRREIQISVTDSAPWQLFFLEIEAINEIPEVLAFRWRTKPLGGVNELSVS